MVAASSAAAQSVFPFSLPFGPQRVGYRSVVVYDHTRNVPRDTIDEAGAPVRLVRPRPIHLSVWYPAGPSTRAPMRYREYLALYGPSLHVPPTTDSARRFADSALAHWDNLMIRNPGVSLEARRDALRAAIAREGAAPTHAIRDAPTDGRAHPIVIYAAGAEGPSFENDVLMEYLASRGYLAIGVPSWTEAGGPIATTAPSLETESRDLEVALGYARELPNEARQNVALMGWSWGGLANVVVASRNQSVSAVISLDGSVRYYWHDASLRAEVNATRPFATPSLFINQGSTPLSLIAQIGGDTTFTFYDSLRYADAYRVTVRDARHQNFASMYDRLAGPQPNFFVADRRTAADAYTTIGTYVVTFLDAYLRNDSGARQRLTLAPSVLGVPDTNLTVDWRRALRPLPTMAAFRRALGKQSWREAPTVLARLQAADPAFTLPDDSLDDAGSMLIDDGRPLDAIGAYLVYTRLYPRQAEAWNDLADAYADVRDTTNAIAAYRHALSVAPGNEHAAAGLKRMGGNPPPRDDR